MFFLFKTNALCVCVGLRILTALFRCPDVYQPGYFSVVLIIYNANVDFFLQFCIVFSMKLCVSADLLST